jgi:serine/threonine protein kinase/DNA-binding winged helix-turn-helix (wHTH) protein
MNSKSVVNQTAQSSGRVWRFAGCEFEELSLQLRVKGRPADLELKPLEVLLQLLLRAGDVIPKEVLLDSVWPDLNVVDGSLATAVSKLRKALGDENSEVIFTVPRVGYRLAVPVQTEQVAAPSLWREIEFDPGAAVPGRPQWRLSRRLDLSLHSEVWLAEHGKTHELRVFKFASNEGRLKGLKREVTVARFLRETLGERADFVRVLEWNLESPPYVIESEYGGLNLAEWAEQNKSLAQIPLPVRISVIADVCRAVAAAHDVGVLHKDLKPANILVKSLPDGTRQGTWQVKVADFGSAALLDPARLEALGITNLGLTQTATMQSSSLTGTLMYLAPEVLSGQRAKATADVYSLGVMLYQIATGNFQKPLAPGWEADIDDPLLREDIAKAACGDPSRRLKTAAELADRLTNLDRRRSEREQQAEAARRLQIAETKRAQARARIPWFLLGFLLAAVLIVVAGLALRTLRNKPVLEVRGVQTVAVLPFQNLSAEPRMDFLRLVLPDEIATALSYVHPLSVRPSTTTRRYAASNLDLQKAASEMGVSVVITGHFLTEQNQLQITYEAVDVADNHILWRDTIVSPLQNLIDARQKLYQQAQGGLAVALGARPPDGSNPTATVPTNEEAYDLYARSLAFSADAESNSKATAMLERAVQLDPGFAPYWLTLGARYYNDSHYIKGKMNDEMRNRGLAADERASTLDPHYGFAQYGLALEYAERGDLLRGYQVAANMLRENPGSEISPFALAYVLRYAGLDKEAETQCEIAYSFDRRNGNLRSCGVAFLEHGDYEKALEYIHLTPDTNWSNALTINILLREGKEKEALQIGNPQILAWPSYEMLLACAAHKPSGEIAALAARVQPEDDPESNYFAATHLAYCGQTKTALDMLKRAVRANYCGYPAMDTDPMFASIRSLPEYAEIRSIGMSCQNTFLSERAKIKAPN